MTLPDLPQPAERARTLIASARVGTLTTYGRGPQAAPRVTVVQVGCDSLGLPVVHLDPDSWAARDLLSRPIATLALAPAQQGCVPPTSVVVVRGGARRIPGRRDDRGRLAFRVNVTSLRLIDGPAGPEGGLCVPAGDYLDARPDPIRSEAPGVLAHLRAAHAAELLACLRAGDHPDAEWAEPTGLTRYGLDLTVLTPSGVRLVRLSFARPLDALHELPPGLRAALTCRCRGAQPAEIAADNSAETP